MLDLRCVSKMRFSIKDSLKQPIKSTVLCCFFAFIKDILNGKVDLLYTLCDCKGEFSLLMLLFS